MTVIGADAVEHAARAGEPLRVSPSDLMTPLARERARDLGVEIVGAAQVSAARRAAASGTTSDPDSDASLTAGGAALPRRAGRDAAALPGRDTPAPATASAGVPATSSGAPQARALRPARAAPRATVFDPAGRIGGPPTPGRIAGLPASAHGPAAPLVGPPSGALYRRGAPLTGGGSGPATTTGPPTTDRPATAGTVTRTGPTGVGRVVVVGAGHVGTIAAMRLADADVFAEVVLVDIDEGRAAGIALDLSHTAALSGFATRIRGVGSVEAAGVADYVIVTAGRPRQPGMSRADLIGANAAIVGDVAARVAATSPQAVLVIVTNPLDEMTQHAWRVSGLPSHRVIGMAGVLDTARFQALAAAGGTTRADRITAWALGSHGEEMVVPLSQATADGRPLDRPGLAEAVARTRDAGAEVVGLLRTGSAFLAPGMSAARMVLAMARDTGEVLPAAVLADGSYGIRGVYVGLPARLGRGGVLGIVELPLRPDELAALRTAADRVRQRVTGLARAS